MPPPRVSINLPEPVMQWLTAQAAAQFLDLPDHVRTLLVQLYRDAQDAPAVVGDVGRRLPAASAPVAGRALMRSGGPQPVPAQPTPTSAVAPVLDNAEPVKTGNSATRSGYRGVYPYGKRWAAVVSVNRKQVRLGTYDSPVDAAKAYDLAVKATGGETGHRQLNFGEPTIPDVLQPYIDRLARGEAFSRAEFAEFERASLIYDARQAGKGPADFTEMLAPLVVDAPPRRLRFRTDAVIVMPALQAGDPTDADTDDGT